MERPSFLPDDLATTGNAETFTRIFSGNNHSPPGSLGRGPRIRAKSPVTYAQASSTG